MNSDLVVSRSEALLFLITLIGAHSYYKTVITMAYSEALKWRDDLI